MEEEERQIQDIMFQVAGSRKGISFDFLHKFLLIYTLLKERKLEFKKFERTFPKTPGLVQGTSKRLEETDWMQ